MPDGIPPEVAAIIDSQSVKTLMSGVRGFDRNKKLVGRKRHILVDTEGFFLAVVVLTSINQRHFIQARCDLARGCWRGFASNVDCECDFMGETTICP
jgi:hypothetical protein